MSKLQKIVCLFLLIIVSNDSHAQKETSNWIFGLWDNWIMFTDSAPVGFIPSIPVYPYYFMSSVHSATISDQNGNLLLYTNGETIWNGQLATVPNGIIYGDEYFPSVIIKRPGWDHRYYVLAADGWFIRYKEINMVGPSSPGNVVLTYTAASFVIPKFSTTYHANGKDIWLLTHGRDNNQFEAFLITEQGIGFTSVTSTIGSLQQDTLPCDLFRRVSWGNIMFSPGGNYVAMSSNGLNLIEVFDFDNETGQVSNVRNIPIERPFSLAFSSNGTLLYFSQHLNCFTSVNCNTNYTDSIPVYQVDLLAGNDSAINGSLENISNQTLLYPSYGGNWLQLANDQNIYCNWAGDVTVISSPNLTGLNCNWNDTGIHYNNYFMNAQGFPNFFTSYLDFNIEFENLCFGDTCMIYTLTNQGFDSICWEFEDTVAGISFSVPNQDTLFHTFSTPGMYEITLKRYRHGNLDELSKRLYIKPAVNIAFSTDTLICQGEEALISVSHPFCDFVWVNDFSTDTVFCDSVTIAEAGNWWPIITNYVEYCGSIDTLGVLIQPDTLNLELSGPPDCITNPIMINAWLPGNCSYQWSTGDTTASILANENGYYWVTVQQNYCTVYDTVFISYDAPLPVNLPDTISLCDSIPVMVMAGDFPADFIWSPNGETTADIVILSPGTYSVTASNGCGDFTDSTIAIYIQQPEVNLGNDSVICTGDTILLENIANGTFDPASYFWSTSEISPAIFVSNAGDYSVTISNACGTAKDTIFVGTVNPPDVNLGNDTVICLGENLLLHTPYSAYSTYLWSTGETATSITVFNQSNYSLSVSNACGTFSDSLLLEVHENLFAFPFDSLLLPSGQTITIDAGPGYVSYFWSNDSTSQSITVGDIGLYWVKVSDSIGCLGSDTVEVVVIDGIQETSAFKNISVYPNPVKEVLVIVGLPIGEYEIYLFNSLGQKAATRTPTLSGSAGSYPAHTETFALSEGFGRCVIDMSGFHKGIYLLSIQCVNEKMVVKVVKE